jgi:A/G-specific adenine glycosylase
VTSAATLTDTQVARVRRRLLPWGRANFKSYPWRSETDPWLSFVAELLLQRTRAGQVESAFLTLRNRYPTAASLASAGLPAVRALTRNLGLHSRGPLLLRIAKTVAALGGEPPRALKELRTLTGVGMYTAAAWLSLHQGQRAPIIDANVSRWLSRMTGLPFNRDPRHVKWIQELVERLTPRRAFRDFNYAVLDFTMTVCIPRNPRCEICLLKDDCRFGLRTGTDDASRHGGD